MATVPRAEVAGLLERELARAIGGPAAVGLAACDGAGEVATRWQPAAEPEPAFLIYSVSKIALAFWVLALCESGRLSLSDRLARWAPDLPGAADITLRHLLGHTAGIRDYGGLEGYHRAVRKDPGSPWSADRFLGPTRREGLLFAPGSGWSYSNPGYLLVRRIAEEASGESFAQAVHARIAQPLGLERTRVVTAIADLADLAPAVSAAVGGRDVPGCYHPGWVSHGVMASTARETARFVHSVLGGELLAPSSLEAMTELVPVPLDRVAEDRPLAGRPGYGLGVMGSPSSPVGVVWGHNGGGPGYTASVFHAPRHPRGATTVAVTCAVEQEAVAEGLVFSVLRGLASTDAGPA